MADTWLQKILTAYQDLGRPVDLKTLCDHIEGTHVGRKLPKTWRATVRERIERHSSDSSSKKKANFADLFYKRGRGEWGVRPGPGSDGPITFELITDEREIASFQNQFQESICDGTQRIRAKPGNPGGNMKPMPVFWNAKTGVYAAFNRGRNRYWNAFGNEIRPLPQTSEMIVQINPSHKGDSRSEGAFVRDRVSGQVFIVHRGGLGGTFQGNDAKFWDAFEGDTVNILRRGIGERVAVVSALEDPDIQRRVAQFVHFVRRLKSLLRSGKTPRSKHVGRRHSVKTKSNFSKEREGQTKYERQASYVEYFRFHGIVVNALRDLLSSEFQIANDVLRDLTIPIDNGKLRALFEVKTDTDLQSVYTAVGQLMMNGRAEGSQTDLVMVSPDLADGDRKRLQELGIHFLSYVIDNGQPRFAGLPALLKRLRR